MHAKMLVAPEVGPYVDIGQSWQSSKLSCKVAAVASSSRYVPVGLHIGWRSVLERSSRRGEAPLYFHQIVTYQSLHVDALAEDEKVPAAHVLQLLSDT